MTTNTLKIWRGTSNNVSVSAYITGFSEYSKNKKLGPLVMQMSVLADGKAPACYDKDYHTAICGGCKLRPDFEHKCLVCGTKNAPSKRKCVKCHNILPQCYVNRKEAPNSIYRFCADKPVSNIDYVKDSLAVAKKKNDISLFRLGMIGNVSVIEENYLKNLCSYIKNDLNMNIVGYVSDWEKYPKNYWLSNYCMASIGYDPNGVRCRKAHKLGWNTFRIKLPNENNLFIGESICKHESQGIKCMNCGLCGGNGNNIVVTLH